MLHRAANIQAGPAGPTYAAKLDLKRRAVLKSVAHKFCEGLRGSVRCAELEYIIIVTGAVQLQSK